MKKRTTNKTIIEIYKELLDGERKIFPSGSWNPTKGGYDNFKRVFRYLILEKLNLNREEFIHKRIDWKFATKYRLKGAISILFNDVLADAINYAIPEWELKPWEMNRVTKNFWNKENAKIAIKWVIDEKLDHKKMKNNNYEISPQLLYDNGLWTLYCMYRKDFNQLIEDATNKEIS